MPAYMTQFSYTNKAAASLVKNPQDRGAVFRAHVIAVGRLHGVVTTLEEAPGVARRYRIQRPTHRLYERLAGTRPGFP